MKYEFNDSYLINKREIEAGSGFDRTSFFRGFQKQLMQQGYKHDQDFHIGDTNIQEGLCLYEDGDFWVVAYLERGKKFAPAFFVDPEDAAMFMRAKLEEWSRPKN
ncbi:MAG: hypothetical protein NBV65_12765 [Burkholderiaceae bacterium]|nr:hypothetical protein [Burkholderiaceae bacterium]